MMENRIPSLKCDTDVFVTFEGDNMVMLQVFRSTTFGDTTQQMHSYNWPVLRGKMLGHKGHVYYPVFP